MKDKGTAGRANRHTAALERCGCGVAPEGGEPNPEEDGKMRCRVDAEIGPLLVLTYVLRDISSYATVL